MPSPIAPPPGPALSSFITGGVNALANPAVDKSGAADSTGPLQATLNGVRDSGGGTVILPPGLYNLASANATPLVIPTNVSLVGSYQGPLSHNGFRDGAPFPTGGGTVLLMPTGGLVQYTSPYIQVNSLNGANACLRGCLLYAPGQSHTASTPVACPPWVAIRGKNGSVLDCELLNPYWGIDINNPTDGQVTERPTVERVTGQPLKYGITIGDQGHNGIADIPRLIDVHFNPWWAAPGSGPADWAQANGTAFLAGDVDEIIARGCFCYGYAIGMQAVLGAVSGAQIPARGPYGSWQGGGFDACGIPVRITASQLQSAIRFEGVGFVSAFTSPKIGLVTDGGAGPVGLVNCDFWGVANGNAANLSGATSVSFSACRFAAYGGGAIAISSGQAIVTGCTFGLANGPGGPAIAQGGSGVVTAVGNLMKTAWTTTGTIANSAANGSF